MSPLSNAAMYNQKKLVGKGDGRKKYIKKAVKLSNELKKWHDQTAVGTVLDAQAKKMKVVPMKDANGDPLLDTDNNPMTKNVPDGELESVIAGGFPRRFVTRDPYDDVIGAKTTLAKALATNQLNRPIPVTEKEVAAYLRKQQQAEEAKLEEFFMRQYATKIVPTDPANLRWAQEIMPSMYSERMKMIEEQAEIQKKVAALKLMGPKSEEDIRFLHGIQRGFVVVRPEPLYKLGGTTLDDELTRGWWSPLNSVVSGTRANRSTLQMPNIPHAAAEGFDDANAGIAAFTKGYT